MFSESGIRPMTLTMSNYYDMDDLDEIFYSDEESDSELFKVGYSRPWRTIAESVVFGNRSSVVMG